MFWHDQLVGHIATAAIPHKREKKVLKAYVDNCLDAIEKLRKDEDEQGS